MSSVLCAFDCGTSAGSVALFQDGALLTERDDLDVAGKGERILNVVKSMVDAIGGAPRVSRWAVGIGPGSMTGVRVALAFAKGVALATGAELVGVSSFDAMDAGVGASSDAESDVVCTVVRALAREYYVRARIDDRILREPSVVLEADVPALVRDLVERSGSGRLAVVGDATIVAPFADAIAALGNDKGHVISSAPHDRPHAKRIGELALTRSADSLEGLVPMYVMGARVTVPA